jgi:predicted membrane protein (TIGR00267 family)
MILFLIKKIEKKFNLYDSMTGMSAIIRRTFVNNSFDGALTMLGVLLGSYVAGIQQPILVIKLGLATSIAVGISGLTGALFAESAERKRQIKKMESVLHRDLEDSEYKKAHDTATILTAMMDGLSPFAASILILLPFFIISSGDVMLAYQASMVLSLIVFFLIGAFIGKTSGDSMLFMGLKLIGAGIICMAIILLLEGIS